MPSGPTPTLAVTLGGEEAGGKSGLETERLSPSHTPSHTPATPQPHPALGKHIDKPKTPPPRLPVALRITVKLIMEGSWDLVRIDGQRNLAMRAPRPSLKF